MSFLRFFRSLGPNDAGKSNVTAGAIVTVRNDHETDDLSSVAEDVIGSKRKQYLRSLSSSSQGSQTLTRPKSVEFSFESLESFRQTQVVHRALDKSQASEALVKKRPNYDNRRRHFLKKQDNRIP